LFTLKLLSILAKPLVLPFLVKERLVHQVTAMISLHLLLDVPAQAAILVVVGVGIANSVLLGERERDK
jgi:hypothetical protein